MHFPHQLIHIFHRFISLFKCLSVIMLCKHIHKFTTKTQPVSYREESQFISERKWRDKYEVSNDPMLPPLSICFAIFIFQRIDY